MEMPVKFVVSLMKVGNSARITIPKEVVAYMKLQKGEKLELWVTDGQIVIEKHE